MEHPDSGNWPDRARARPGSRGVLVAVAAFMLATAVVLVLVVRQLSVGSESQLSAAFAVDEGSPQPVFARANTGWAVHVVPVPSGAAALRYRVGDGAWRDTGSQLWFMLPPEQRATTLQLAFVNASGKQSPPQTYSFEPQRELAVSLRRNLEQLPSGWVAFQAWTASKSLIYFTFLVSNRCALREVRYGLDGAPPITQFELPPCTPFEDSPMTIGPGVRPYLEVPASTRSITVALTYADGSRAEPRTFQAPAH